MYKIAIIGDSDSVRGFMALGFSVREAEDFITAGRILHTLASDPEYAVIFVTEQYAEELEEDIAKYKSKPLPAIISVPGQSGSTGYGLSSIKHAVERAVGADIIFKENN